MAKMIELEIKNYRCIKAFHENFISGKEFVCLVGRGDSGKSTILNAIASVLSPAWNLSFYDTDFFNCNVENPIEIIASLIDLPEGLLLESKYGLHHRVLNPNNNRIEDELTDGYEKVLSIKLKVDKTLEPKWSVINKRLQEDIDISATDRAKLNCFLVSDEIDRHFSWNRGAPLYSLSKINNDLSGQENMNIIVEAIRDAKKRIDQGGFENLSTTINTVKSKVAALGFNISEVKTSIDFKDLYIKDGRISLHDDNIPFKLKGKGSKRLISIGIQSAIADIGGVMLVDELEQGLEPDRIKQLVRSLKEIYKGQVFVTTHSRDVITELESKHLRIVHNKESEVILADMRYDDENLQKTVRACPEAFFAKKIIVCEGSTEIGICRALDKYRKSHKKDLLCFKNCAYVDGQGIENTMKRAMEIGNAGFEVSVICDSDKDSEISPTKDELRLRNIEIFDCEKGKHIEDQVFADLPWDAVNELLNHVITEKYANNVSSLEQSIKSQNGNTLPEDWRINDTAGIRKAIAKSSTIEDKEWFKRIDRGEYLGTFIFKYFHTIRDKKLGRLLTGLSDWVDK